MGLAVNIEEPDLEEPDPPGAKELFLYITADTFI